MPSDGKSPHCLWQGELKNKYFLHLSSILICTVYLFSVFLCIGDGFQGSTHKAA
jgi:hypothetical protein